MEKAIKKALELGYIFQPESYMHVGRDGRSDRNYQAIREDPLFWQALRDGAHLKGGWLIHWHRFVDFLGEGGTADKFFESLI